MTAMALKMPIGNMAGSTIGVAAGMGTESACMPRAGEPMGSLTTSTWAGGTASTTAGITGCMHVCGIPWVRA